MYRTYLAEADALVVLGYPHVPEINYPGDLHALVAPHFREDQTLLEQDQRVVVHLVLPSHLHL